MSDIFKKIWNNKKQTEDDEDRKAYEEQLRAFNQAQKILQQQQLEEEQRKKLIEDAQMGVTMEHPNIYISHQHQDGLDGLLNNQEKAIIDGTDLTESIIDSVKINSRRHALSSMFYTIESLEKIYKFIEETSEKRQQFKDLIEQLLKNNNQIKWVNSEAIDILYTETKHIFDKNIELLDRINIIESEKLKLQEELKETQSKNKFLEAENKALKRELDDEK